MSKKRVRKVLLYVTQIPDKDQHCHNNPTIHIIPVHESRPYAGPATACGGVEVWGQANSPHLYRVRRLLRVGWETS